MDDTAADHPPARDTQWQPWSPLEAADALTRSQARWWVSGGSAIDLLLDRPSERDDLDLSTTAADLGPLCDALPHGISAWADLDGQLAPLGEAPGDADLQRVLLHDDQRGVWVAELHVEDGAPKAWLYRRDPRLQLPWAEAVVDHGGIPVGALQVQLLWKALRPSPQDDADRADALPLLDETQRAWLGTALLRIHPHSSWAIHTRSPFAPAKASWNRGRR
ncbi:nucleotidyltransferase domain-containing protein [Luteococcus sp. OSA5]|uniref:nucleotidyltransferase domain-containing protein n=1 Tax=Luteococcus sp. OSA5 TaxID=3401630 RepID=UPI003B43700C